MDLKLVKETDSILTTKCKLFNFNSTIDLEELISDLLKLMYDTGGIGLAAPQVGLDYRIFVLKTVPYVMINPELISVSEETSKEKEGCLSFPKLVLPIERHNSIVVTFQNLKGEYITEHFDGLTARVIQHELDHLNGITFKSRVSKLVLNIAEKKRKKFFIRREQYE